MGKRIQITGYIDTDMLHEDDVDLDDSTGLSVGGYERIIQGIGTESIPVADLDNIEVELLDD